MNAVLLRVRVKLAEAGSSSLERLITDGKQVHLEFS